MDKRRFQKLSGQFPDRISPTSV